MSKGQVESLSRPTQVKEGFVVDDAAAQDQVFHCRRCGQQVTFCGGWAPPDHPELASGICSHCLMRERAEGLPVEVVASIRAAARAGQLPAVKLARDQLGWSLLDAILLVDVLTTGSEPVISPSLDEGDRD